MSGERKSNLLKNAAVKNATVKVLIREIAVAKVKGPEKINLCCGDGVFEAVEFKGAPTEEEKSQMYWRIENGEGKPVYVVPPSATITAEGPSSTERKVESQPQEQKLTTPRLSLKESFAKEGFAILLRRMKSGDQLRIRAYFKRPEQDGAFATTTVEKGAEDEVCSFIGLIRKLEALKPKWSGERMLNSLWKLQVEHNLLLKALFHRMYGTVLSDFLNPFSDDLSNDDTVQSVKTYSTHDHDGSGAEIGVVKDCLERPGDKPARYKIAIGHAFTGMMAGLHRIESVALFNGVDNLYATTISGDLGQSAIKKMYYDRTGHKNAEIHRILGGEDKFTEATEAELIGDIDGFLLGSTYRSYNGQALSDILTQYYCDPAPAQDGIDHVHHRKRFQQFQSVMDWNKLPDQVERFMYRFGLYKHYLPDPPIPPDRGSRSDWESYESAKQKFDAEIAAIKLNAQMAVNEFKSWLRDRVAEENARENK